MQIGKGKGVARSRLTAIFVARSRLTAILVGALLGTAVLVGCGGSTRSSKSALTAYGLQPASYGSGLHSDGTARSSGFQRKGPQRVSRRAGAGFLRHAGLAFGIFQRDVYVPFKSGQLNSRHKLVLATAATATSVTLREVTAAKEAAGGPPGLRALFFPLGALQINLISIEKRLKRGHADPTDIRAANSIIRSIDTAASQSGLRIVDEIPAIAPTASNTGGTASSRKRHAASSHAGRAQSPHARRARSSHARSATSSHAEGSKSSHTRSATP